MMAQKQILKIDVGFLQLNCFGL